MKMTKIKKLLCCFSVCALAVVGGATAISASKVVDAAAEGSTFTMLGGSIRLNATTPGIRFQASISDAEYQAITNPESESYDATAVFGMMIAPVDYMTGIEVGEDYIVELAKKELSVSPIIHYSQPWQKEVEEGEPVDTNWYINGSISNVLYENSNREFFGISFMRTGEAGSYVYTYPELNSMDEMSRSMSEIAVKAREDKEWTYSDDQYEIIDKYIARGVNLANGADKEATPSVTVSFAKTRSMCLVGETFDLSASFAPAALDLKLEYSSSDPTVAKVTNNTVEILAEGTVEITATVKNYGTTLDITPATMSITAGTLEFAAPNYMAVGKAQDLTVTFSGFEVPGVEYSAENMSVNGASVTPTKAGTTTITATVSYEGVTATVSTDVKVVDFGATSGEMVDLARNVDAWNYRNYNDAEGVTLTYTENKVADGRPIANTALHYYRPDNTGAASGATGKLVYLHPEIIDLAKAQGFKQLTYFIRVPQMSGVSTAHSSTAYVVNEDGTLYYKGSNSINFNWNSNTSNWTRSIITLSNIPDGKGVGFIGYAKDTYLTNVCMIGSNGSAIETSLLDQSTINNQVKTVDLAKEELLGKLFVTDMSNATLSIEKGADTARNLDAVVITRDAGTYTYSATNKLNGLVISSEWIQAAKAKGCTCIVFRYYNANGGLSIYKVKDNDTAINASGANSYLFTVSNATTTWGFIGISIENFQPGERLVISFAGSTLKLSNIEFRTTYYASSLVAKS